MRELLEGAAERAIRYLEGIDERQVFPDPQALSRLSELDSALPEVGVDPQTILETLDRVGSPASVRSAGSRYFGFVIGGSLPAALAAQWLAGAWDQNAALTATSPIGAKVEEVALTWLLDVLGLPENASGGFVTGATMANFTALAAARHALLHRQGWDVEGRGMFGAPPIKVIVGEEVHVSLLKSLSMLGFGRDRLTRVAVDGQGRMRADSLPEMNENTLLCIQAGNVNTGAFDPAPEICKLAHNAGAWIHVDGAFGLWARACPTRAQLADGFEQADSWATDAHKWLNVPYDSGLAFCRDKAGMTAAMSATAAYLITGDHREPAHYTPEFSRRARGIEIWAALLSLGRAGLADMIERDCRLAKQFADGLATAGYEILNDVVLNQVLVSFGDPETTTKIVTTVEREGTSWFGGTVWQGRTAMRISVSSWATTEIDVERSLAAIIRVAKEITR